MSKQQKKLVDSNLSLNQIQSDSLAATSVVVKQTSVLQKAALQFNFIGGNGNDNTIVGGDANEVITSGDGNDNISGGNGIDLLIAGDGNDVLAGGKDNDLLVGGNGDDCYIFNAGDGHDIVYENTVTPGQNTIVFGAGLAKEYMNFSAAGNDLVISFITAPNDSVKITDFLKHMSDPDSYLVKYLQFADGSCLDLSDSATLKLNYNARYVGEYVLGNNLDNVLNGSQGDDTLSDRGGNDTLNGRDGNDILYAGTGDDFLNGGRGDDKLYGEAGNNTFIYNLGDGSDKIFSYNNTNSVADTIVFGEGISASDLVFSTSINTNNLPGKDFIIKFKNSEGSINIANYFSNDGTSVYKGYNLKFADGSVVDLKDFAAITVNQNGSDNSETIWSSPYNSIVNAGGGDDVINIVGQEVEASGGEGNDTFVISGQTKVATIDDFSVGDRINLVDINVTDITGLAVQQGSDAVMSFDSGQKIIFKNTDAATLTNDKFDFRIVGDDSANVINGNNLLGNYIDGKGGDDTITTGNANDKIFGGDGNDTIKANDGINVIDGGAGNDVIHTALGYDTVRGGEGDDRFVIDKAENNDFHYGKIMDFETNNPNEKIDLSAFTDVNSFDQIRISKLASSIYFGNQVVALKDIDVSKLTADNFIFAPKALTGSDGRDDFIVTNGKNEIIKFGSNDTIHFQSPEMTADKMLLSYNGNDTVVQFEGLSDFTLTLDKFDYAKLGESSFAFDGVPEGAKDYNIDHSVDHQINIVDKNTATFSNAADNYINGNDSNDVINGLGGDDIIYGSAGDDTLRGQEGDDMLIGGSGRDTLIGGSGNDTFNFISLNDSTDQNIDVITDFVQGEDRIQLTGSDFEGVNLEFTKAGSDTLITDANSDFAIKVAGDVALSDIDLLGMVAV